MKKTDKDTQSLDNKATKQGARVEKAANSAKILKQTAAKSQKTSGSKSKNLANSTKNSAQKTKNLSKASKNTTQAATKATNSTKISKQTSAKPQKTSSLKPKNLANSTKNSAKNAKNSAKISSQSKAKPKNSAKTTQNSAKISKISSQKSHAQTPATSQKTSPEKPKKSARFLARQKKIKRVALRFFLAKGYEGTNVRDIIKTSGGSFSDIYGTFKDKQGLFVGVLSDLLSVKRNIYTKLLNKNLPMREFLYKFSTDIMGTFLEKKALHLAKIIYSQLYKRSNRALIEYFRENKENAPGKVLVSYFQRCEPPLRDEAHRYAELFLTMLKGRCVEELFFNESIMSKQEQESHCAFVVDFFIRGLPK